MDIIGAIGYPMDYIPTQQVGIHKLIIMVMLFVRDKPYLLVYPLWKLWEFPAPTYGHRQMPPSEVSLLWKGKALLHQGKNLLFQGMTFPQMKNCCEKMEKNHQISVISLKNDIWKIFCGFMFVQNIIFVWVIKGFWAIDSLPRAPSNFARVRGASDDGAWLPMFFKASKMDVKKSIRRKLTWP